MNDAVVPLSIPTPFFEGTSNAFLLRGSPLTLVDTGINGPDAFETLERGLANAGVSVERIERILLTHKHADHMGLARAIVVRSGAKVFVHTDDHHDVTNYEEVDREWTVLIGARLREWGAPTDRLEKVRRMSGMRTTIAYSVEAEKLEHGQTLPMSGSPIEVIHVPGHTKGSVCFRWGNRLFSGDHVLPSITPNVGIGELRRVGMLREYLESLESIKGQQTPDLVVYPGHGEPFGSLAARAEVILAHHVERLDEIERIVAESGPLSVYDVAIRHFGELEGFHLPLGAAEAHAHLEHLADEGRVVRDNGCWRKNN